MSFDSLGLKPELLRAVADKGYTEPTPIQKEAIPAVLEGRDVLAGAQTGTGKTAGFTLPMLQILAPHANTSPSPARHPIRALILTPTRELAAQILEDLEDLAVHTPITSASVFGGVAMGPQEHAFRTGVDVIVATPGRLLDHLRFPYAKLDKIEHLVLDEADRMLDMGFIVDVETILSRCPRNRQTALFSATMPYAILRICDRFMKRNPAQVTVRPDLRTVETVRQLVYFVAEQDKVAALLELTDQFGFDRLLQQLAGSRSEKGRQGIIDFFGLAKPDNAGIFVHGVALPRGGSGRRQAPTSLRHLPHLVITQFPP